MTSKTFHETPSSCRTLSGGRSPLIRHIVKLQENLKQLEWKPTKLVRPFIPDRTSYYSRFSPLAVTSCSFPCFHRSLKPSCCFQEPQHRSQVLSEEDATIGHFPRGILHKSKSTSHLFAISTVQWMPAEWGWLFWSVLLFVLWKCSTVSVPYTCMISLLNSTLFSFKLLATEVWRC